MGHRATLIPGDGIGPEVVAAARAVLDATAEIEWDVQEGGAAAHARGGSALPAALVDSVRATGVALKGPLSTPPGSGRAVNVALRDELGLHLGVRPCRALPGAPAPLGPVDVVVARMTDGDLYAGIEFPAGDAAAEQLRALVAASGGQPIAADAGIALKPISRSAAERSARALLEWMRVNARRRVTVVHKASVMPATDGVFLEAARAAAGDFPEIELDDRLVDAVCHDLVTRPHEADVLFAPMLYGDLLADLCAGLVGGLGMVPGVNLGDGCAVFEPVHGTAPRHAGAGRANPVAMVLCGALLLDHIGEQAAARSVREAVAAVVREGTSVTYDLRPGRSADGAAGTAAVADAVIAAL